MSEPAISVRELGKRYRLGEAASSYRTLREALTLTKRSRRDTHKRETIWALRNISFDVPQGQVVGVIGRNGAGKSTLLKILSRITEPSEGCAQMRGRVGSLLEVGTGFHLELTGAENIFLNGAILGMTRQEVDRKFDEIIEFAEVDRFVDTPVKRYSTGMRLRLGFSVAAHLEPEILLVDEVLAVGDAAFQRRCLGKIGEVATEGRTVILVSHNMAAIESLCTRVLWIEKGAVAGDSSKAQSVIENYLGFTSDLQVDSALDMGGRVIRSLSIGSSGNTVHPLIITGGVLKIHVVCDAERPISSPRLSYELRNSRGVLVGRLDTRLQMKDGLPTIPARRHVISCRLDNLPLLPDRYFISAKLFSHRDLLEEFPEAASFEVAASDFFGTGRPPRASHGVVALSANWSAGRDVEV